MKTTPAQGPETPPRETVEHRTIEHIPVDERHGSATRLFTIWFGSNVMLLTVASGALATAVYGLPVWAAVLALVIGNVVGGVVMALHAAQGPQVGVPQMLQTRAQFGSYGSLLVVTIVVVMSTAFFASDMVLGGQALADLTPGNFENFMLLLLCVLIPWTAVNLVDYYLIRHGEHDIPSLFDPDGGIYERINIPAVGCYLLGILVQVPFLSNALYTGPIATPLDGVDISWIVGLAVICPVYYFWARATTSSPERIAAEPVTTLAAGS